MMKLIDMVKGKIVTFEFYRSGLLWYKTEDGFTFPVPISECGDSKFLKEDKATLFMRYIKAQLKEVEKEASRMATTEELDKTSVSIRNNTELMETMKRMANV